MDKELLITSMANREFLYRYLWRFYTTYADMDFLKTIESEAAAEQIKLFCGEESPANQSQAILVELAKQYENEPGMDEGLDQLKSEYTRLFLGPAALPAPPWESVYASGEELMFTVRTLTIRYFYKDMGYVSLNGPKEAEDFLGTELGFMAALARDTKQALEEGNDERVRFLLEKQQVFVRDHLFFLVSHFTPRLRERAIRVGEFYLSAADLTYYICQADLGALEEILAVL